MDKEPENTDLSVNSIILKMLEDAIKEEEEHFKMFLKKKKKKKKKKGDSKDGE